MHILLKHFLPILGRRWVDLLKILTKNTDTIIKKEFLMPEHSHKWNMPQTDFLPFSREHYLTRVTSDGIITNICLKIKNLNKWIMSDATGKVLGVILLIPYIIS